jgi:hypothetical protein
MITFAKDNNIIRIIKDNVKIYTIAEKTYRCLNQMGLGADHVVSMIEQVHKITLPVEDAKEVRSYFNNIWKETKVFSKK